MAGSAENVPGLNIVPKSRVPAPLSSSSSFVVFNYYCTAELGLSGAGAVGERSKGVEAGLARAGGALGSENVGMSNHNAGEKPAPRKSKVSVAMAISYGLGDPKAMEKSVVE